MNDSPAPELEKQLSQLTTWPGPTPNLWRRALKAAQAAERTGTTRLRRAFPRRVPTWALAGAAAAIIFITVGVWMTSAGHLQAQRPTPEFLGGERARQHTLRNRFDFRGYNHLSYGYQVPSAAKATLAERVTEYAEADTPSTARSLISPSDTQPPLDRQVVRKATIQLATDDVRAAFLQAAHLISEARGEYVAESSQTGTGRELQASLTLRVAADRLSEVLNELRQLGEVRSERTTGEDVTAQVVDLEARLRNEGRIETELLQLLEKRADSPLNEILELRRTLADVRQTIEQLTAQREQLSRLVSLATVLVIIRPSDAPDAYTTGVAAYFLNALTRAWNKGVLFLVDTLAVCLSILIGGLIWWVLLVAAVLTLRTYRRRTIKPATHSPPPPRAAPPAHTPN